MAKVAVAAIKDLRAETGAGVMDCRRALEESSGNLDEARRILRAAGLERAAERSGRETGEGIIQAYIHPNRPLAAMVKLTCETDFVARTDEFKNLAREVAMHIAALAPERINAADGGDGDALLEQSYVRDPSRTIGDLISDSIARTGENIRVSEFARFEI
jgi:elongation factor Ts